MWEALPARGNPILKATEIDAGVVTLPEFTPFGIALSDIPCLFKVGINPVLKFFKERNLIPGRFDSG